MKTFMGMFTLVALALVIPHVEYAIFGDGVHSMHCDMELVPR